MHRFLYLLLVSLTTLGIVKGLAILYPPIALTPAIQTSDSEIAQLPVESLAELYQIRDRLQANLEQSGAILAVTSTPTARLQMLQAVEIRIQVEEIAKEKWDQAIQLAVWARELESMPNSSVELLGNIPLIWQQAIGSLQEVPESSFLAEFAHEKVKEYEKYLAIASYKFDTAKSGFLEPIVKRTGLPLKNVRITVCDVFGVCRRWYGNQPPASPASLIKVPIAIALMQYVATKNISLDTKIQVSRSNYTEDASDIGAGGEYTLRQLLMRMINQSSNIATNQLIDYLGRDYINQFLRDRGYPVTQVNSKLVGESTYPSNVGSGANRITTDELTDMMVQIYNLEHPGDQVLLDALASQYDKVLGYEGLKKSIAIWKGEKTGRNSKALGSTLAMTIDNEYYFLSVVFNYSSNERAMRGCINDIAKYISSQGHL